LTKIAAWLNAARLRTLPLSVSGIVVGSALARFYEKNDLLIFILALLTTIGFQVTSNFANDYGDGVKGTDNEDRVGPKRALQSGLLTRKELKTGILISIVICLILVATLIYFAFGTQQIEYFILFGVLGTLSIWAAIKYTVGTSAYGYRGLGDIFVFVFFGFLAVLGSLFLYTKFITAYAWLPAIAVGALSTAVLNLNNLRDYESDKKANKNTVIVKMGIENGKVYHYILIAVAFISMLLFIVFNFEVWYQFIPLLAFIPIGVHVLKVNKTEVPQRLDPELKKLALSTFLMSFLFYITFI
jgi:1,4-dihydroxy-2-naphthoate octaprenyltransferase